MTQLMRASMKLGPAPKPSRQVRAPVSSKPLAESFRFVEWADEYRILELYRRLVVRGDDAAKSLPLIRGALGVFGYPLVEGAVHAYVKEAAPSEPRFRKRPFTFFQPGIIEQYIPVDKLREESHSQTEELREQIARAQAIKGEAMDNKKQRDKRDNSSANESALNSLASFGSALGSALSQSPTSSDYSQSADSSSGFDGGGGDSGGGGTGDSW